LTELGGLEHERSVEPALLLVEPGPQRLHLRDSAIERSLFLAGLSAVGRIVSDPSIGFRGKSSGSNSSGSMEGMQKPTCESRIYPMPYSAILRTRTKQPKNVWVGFWITVSAFGLKTPSKWRPILREGT
jgi:hypothetical protein